MIANTDQMEGRTGKLAFVTLRHEISQAGWLKLTDWQDLVCREAAPGLALASISPAGGGQ